MWDRPLARTLSMPLAGQGMLLTSMDIEPSDEADFNRWYDQEHLEERVAIEGFIEARRYVAEQASPKYLCLYSTETIEVLDSEPYRARLANPTEWSVTTMAMTMLPLSCPSARPLATAERADGWPYRLRGRPIVAL